MIECSITTCDNPAVTSRLCEIPARDETIYLHYCEDHDRWSS